MTAWETPRRFLMVFMQRSGSTFLAHCLDSHPDIGAERGEPLYPDYIWRQTFPEATSEQLLDLVLRRPGYRVTVARVNYRHVQSVGEGYLSGLDGYIFLHRENVVRNMISSHINAAGVKAAHSFEPQRPVPIVIDPEEFIQGYRRSEQKRAAAWDRLSAVARPGAIHATTYEAITGGAVEATGIPQPEADSLCDFLGVSRAPLSCTLKRINPEPPSVLVTNWPELEAVLRESEYTAWLE